MEAHKVGVFGEFRNLSKVLRKVRVDAFYQKNDKFMANHVETTPSIIKMPLTIDNWADNSLDQYGFALQTDWAVTENNFLVAGYEFNNDDLNATSTTQARRTAFGNMMIGRLPQPQNTSSGKLRSHRLLRWFDGIPCTFASAERISLKR